MPLRIVLPAGADCTRYTAAPSRRRTPAPSWQSAQSPQPNRAAFPPLSRQTPQSAWLCAPGLGVGPGSFFGLLAAVAGVVEGSDPTTVASSSIRVNSQHFRDSPLPLFRRDLLGRAYGASHVGSEAAAQAVRQRACDHVKAGRGCERSDYRYLNADHFLVGLKDIVVCVAEDNLCANRWQAGAVPGRQIWSLDNAAQLIFPAFSVERDPAAVRPPKPNTSVFAQERADNISLRRPTRRPLRRLTPINLFHASFSLTCAQV